MPTEWKWGLRALGALLAAICLLGWVYTSDKLSAAKDDLGEAQRQLAIARRVHTAGSAANAEKAAVVSRANKEQGERIAIAIKANEANPDWANEPIPADVLAGVPYRN